MFSKRFSALWLRMAVLALVASFVLLNHSQPASAQTSGVSPMTTPHENVLLSVTSTGAQANNTSTTPKASANGEVVVFASTATNLVANDTNGFQDIFTYNRFTKTTECLTCISLLDGLPTDNHSWNPDISEDGRYVVFASNATDLVAIVSGEVAYRQLYIYDRYAQTAQLVGSGGNQNSDYPVISANGQFIAFESLASNLVSGDTNNKYDIFVYDQFAKGGSVERISVNSSGNQVNYDSQRPSISADGQKVAFYSFGALATGDNNIIPDVFMRDRATNTIQLVSKNSSGSVGNSSSMWSSISEDGNFVVFQSSATNLVSGDTNARADIFMRNLLTNSTTRVSVGTGGVQGNGTSSSVMDVSKYGQYVLFSSSSSNLVTGDTNGTYDTFLHEVATGQTKVISTSPTGVMGNGSSAAGAFAAGEDTVAFFTSSASNLVASDTNAKQDVFAYVLKTIIPATTTILTNSSTQYLASVSPNGATYTFSQSTPELATLAAGDTMMMGISTHTPNGNLRKVVSVNTFGNQVIVNTIPGTFNEAIQQGEISLNMPLDPDQVQQIVSHVDGLTFSKAPTGSGTFVITIPDVTLYEDENGGKVTLDGSMEFETSLNAKMRVIDLDLQQLRFTQNIKTTKSAEVFVGLTAELPEEDFSKTLASYFFPPVTVFAGPAPVIVIPRLDFVVGLEGSLSVGLTFEYGQTVEASAYIDYSIDRGWTNGRTASLQTGFIEPPTLGGSMETRVYAGPRAQILLYGLVGPYSKVEVYGRAEIDNEDNWEIAAGVKAAAGFAYYEFVTFFTGNITEYEILSYQYEQILLQSESSLVPTLVSGFQESAEISLITPSGDYVVFEAFEPNTGGNNLEVFIKSVGLNNAQKLSNSCEGRASLGGVSATGRYVTYVCRLFGIPSILYLVDTQTGTETALYSGNFDFSSGSSLSANGRFVAYSNGQQVFVIDTQEDTTTQVSVSSSGTSGNNDSFSPSISGNGRYVAFSSDATNLVANDTNGVPDVFVHDLVTDITKRVSVSSTGVQGNNQSLLAWFSGAKTQNVSYSGNYIVFTSTASNLVSTPDTAGKADVFLHDLTNGTTIRISNRVDGGTLNDDSYEPSISSNGEYVVFVSVATDILQDTSPDEDVFRYEVSSGELYQISVDENGNAFNENAFMASVSDDGFVALTTEYTVTNEDTDPNDWDVYLYSYEE